MVKSSLIFITVLLVSFCFSFNSKNIIGKWHLNQWTSYHTLIFNDSTVFVDNHVDTVFFMEYTISNDNLILWTSDDKQRFTSKIIKLTNDSLVLDRFLLDNHTRTYTRNKK